jgi:RecB family exonuclease
MTPKPVNGHAAIAIDFPEARIVAPPSTGIADSLSPSQVRNFTDCAFRWFQKYVLGYPDPPTSNLALGTAAHAAIAVNFREKIETKQDLETEGVVGIYRNAWNEQEQLAVFRDEEDPQEIRESGAELVRLYMNEVAPKIQPAAVELPVKGVLGGVRINGIVDVLDVNGKIIDTKTAKATPSSIDPMYRFQVATYRRLAPNASGLVQLDTLVKNKTPKRVEQSFEITEADIRATDTIYPLAQQAMRTGYYMPNRLSMLCSRRHCPYWRRCEKEFGGEVSES